jgi:hypothetical protein
MSTVGLSIFASVAANKNLAPARLLAQSAIMLIFLAKSASDKKLVSR